ncbi:MAG: rhomboid family intramembrane serine protease [Pseudomonadota bacterium]
MAPAFNNTWPDTEPAAFDGPAGHAPAPAWCTLLILLAMLGLTAMALDSAGNWLAASNDALLKWDGHSAIITLESGNWWRLVASRLQLGSMIGILAFLPFFWVVSGAFERIYGALSLLLFFVLVSASCSVTALYFRDFETISVGAGGPALGLGMCLLVAMWRGVEGAPQMRDFSLPRGLALLPLPGLLGFAVLKGSADLGSLIAGLMCGGVLGLLLQPKAASVDTGRKKPLAALAACLIVVLTIAAAPFTRPGRLTTGLSSWPCNGQRVNTNRKSTL